MLVDEPLHPLKHALQIFTDASKEVWRAHLDEHTARGTWSLPESKLHINHLELKAVFLALKDPPNLPRYQLTRGLTKTRHEKDAMTSHCLNWKRKYNAPPGECALLTGPAGIIYRMSFLTFGGTGRTDR